MTFERALERDPTFTPAAFALADVIQAAEGEMQGELVLRKALETNPRSSELQHALGFSLVRQKRTSAAMGWLAKAAQEAPANPLFSYVHAVALHDTGRWPDAVAVLKSALTRHPYDRELLMALMSYEIESRDFRSALARAEVLSRLEPDRRGIAQLLARLRRQLQ